MLNKKECLDLYQTLALVQAKALRLLADQLEKVKTAGEIAQVSGDLHKISSVSAELAAHWMNDEKKVA